MDLGTVKIVKMGDIIFDESTRGRVDYGDIGELAESIREEGLINPITVYSPSLLPPYELLAGGRRFKALCALGAELVSVRIYEETLTDKQKRIIELYENLKRKELSYIERANMTSLIHETLQSIHGPKLPGGTQGHSTRDTARLLGVSQQTVNNDIKIAKIHSSLPELALEEKKNAAAALHTINRLEYAVQVRANNPEIASSNLAESYKVGDFFHSPLASGEFHFIEIDPPYAIDANSVMRHRERQDSGGYKEIHPSEYEDFIEALIKKCTLAAAKDSYLMIWTPPQWYLLVYQTLSASGWDVEHVPAIWYKTNSPGQTRNAEFWMGGSYEPFLYAKRGAVRLSREGRSNVFSYPILHPSRKIHPTEKPYDLMQDIINTFCHPNSSILVPFAGSGVTIAAASDLGHKVVGYDVNEAFRQDFITKFSGE
jgi:ParB/RepB/Spo0J family partition protein